MLDFNVAQLLKSQVGETRQYDVDETIPALDEYATAEPVRGQVKLTRTKRGVLVDARLTTAVRLECSRCLEGFVAPLRLRIGEEYLPTVDIATGLPVQSPEDADALRIDEHHILDLTEAVRQYVLLEVPIQPLCRAECAGLCPTCGQNLNRGQCACPPQPQPGGLADLGRLLSQAEDKE